LANYWLKNIIVSKENPFLLLPPVSLTLCGLRKQQNWDIQKMNRMNWIKGEDMITQ